MKRTRWRLWHLILLPLPLWFLAWGAAQGLVVKEPLERADAIVVLAGSLAFIERTERAAQLYAERRAPRIILTNDNEMSGWSNVEERNPFFYERARTHLLESGVPPEGIEVLTQPVTGTYHEAVLLRAHAEANGLKSLVVVTSPYHSRRALWTMRRVFRGSGVIIGLDPTSFVQSPPPSTWWLRRRGWKAVPLEYAKLFYYHLRYTG